MPSLVSHKLSIIMWFWRRFFFFLCFDHLIWTWSWTRTSLDSDLTRTRTSLDLDLTRTRTSLDSDLTRTRTSLDLDLTRTRTSLDLDLSWTWTCLGLDKGGLDYSPTIGQVFDRSHADTAVGHHLTRIGRAGKDSDLIVACSAFIQPLELIIFACFATIGHSIGLAWANRTSGNVGGKEFP